MLARLVEAKADDVVFTSGATEANALAMLGHVRALRAVGRQSVHVLYLPSAHASIVENARLLAEEGAIVEALPIRDGQVDTKALAQQLRKETVLVSMDAVCGETGTVWNTREVAQLLQTHAGAAIGGERALLHVDASQAPLTQNVTRAHFGADLLTLDGSKIGPLRGIGALIAHRTIPLVSLYQGGGQERGLRPGTESPERAKRFASLLRTAARHHEVFRAMATAQRAFLTARINTSISNVSIYEAPTQTPHIMNLSLPGRDTDYLVALLDEAGFAVSTRSACETDSEEGSRAVFALTGDATRAKSTIRVSWGPGTSTRSLNRFAAALEHSVAFIDMKAKR